MQEVGLITTILGGIILLFYVLISIATFTSSHILHESSWNCTAMEAGECMEYKKVWQKERLYHED